MTSFDALGKLAHRGPARLAPAMMLDETADQVKLNAHPSQQAQ